MFLDEVQIEVTAGDGGDGMVAFRREKYVPHGGPAGGDGGAGGDVVLVVNPKLSTLASFDRKRHFRAAAGGRGGSANKTGAAGNRAIVEVPRGTIVRDAASGMLLADLTEPGQQVIVARGGRGGRGNTRFKSSTNQAPRMAEKGEPGEERRLSLELKLIADVGIIGVPNAGKSTLLSVISAARPKIASYPFTTLEPNLGVAVLDDAEIVFADIPGLLEGAHQGVGLGHSFLRHIQRTRLLVHLLDGAGQDPLADYAQINTELSLYDERLLDKPQVVALNKIELRDAQASWDAVHARLEELGLPNLAISAVTGRGVRSLLELVKQELADLPEKEAPAAETPVMTLEQNEDHFEIKREEAGFRISGERIERAANMTYWEYDEALVRFHRILTALGIASALQNAGIQDGDTVYIGEHELEWRN